MIFLVGGKMRLVLLRAYFIFILSYLNGHFIFDVYNTLMKQAQIIFKVDKDLKRKAVEKSKRKGMPLSYFLKHALKAFVDGRLSLSLLVPKIDLKLPPIHQGAVDHEEMTPEEYVEYVRKDWK